MADERDDKKLGEGAHVNKPSGPVGALTPTPSPANREPNERGLDVAQEVARVVNLLQRLEKLHAKPPAAGSTALPTADPEPAGRTGPPAPQSPLSQLQAPQARPAPAMVHLPPPLPSGGAPAAHPPRRTEANAPPLEGPLPTPVMMPRDDGLAADFTTLVSTQTPISTARAPDAAKTRPSALVLGVLATLSATVAAWGILRLQAGSDVLPSAGLAANPTSRETIQIPQGASPRPSQATTLPASTPSAVPAPQKAAEPPEPPSSCAATLASTPDGAVNVVLKDLARAGQPVTLKVEDVSYPTSFDAKGGLRFEAPLLSKRALISWSLADGSSCQKAAEWTAAAPLLRVALMWTGTEALDLHVIEPNAWLGSPTGHVSIDNANADLSHGAGRMQSYGRAGDGTRIAVYAVDRGRLASGAVLNVFVKAAPVEKSQLSASDCGTPARPMHATQIPYQLFILKSGPDGSDLDRETKSFSMAIPPCGAVNETRDRTERIIVKN